MRHEQDPDFDWAEWWLRIGDLKAFSQVCQQQAQQQAQKAQKAQQQAQQQAQIDGRLIQKCLKLMED